MTAPVVALVPVSPPGRAKARLAGLLSPDQRQQVALTTLAIVVSAARGAGFEPVVVTADPRALPAGLQARVLPERVEGGGLNAALEGALSDIGGVPEALLLHADLPLASPGALARVRAGLPTTGDAAVLVRSRDGGTNAMLLRPPGRFQLAYGSRSFARHVAAAAGAGLAVMAVDEPSLALDLDTPADIGALLASAAGRASPVGRLLLDWGVTGR